MARPFSSYNIHLHAYTQSIHGFDCKRMRGDEWRARLTKSLGGVDVDASELFKMNCSRDDPTRSTSSFFLPFASTFPWLDYCSNVRKQSGCSDARSKATAMGGEVVSVTPFAPSPIVKLNIIIFSG